MRYVFVGLTCLVLVPLVPAQDKTVDRFVEFRDGSIVRLPVVDREWQVTLVQAAGKLAKKTVRPSQVASVTLTDEQNFEKKLAMFVAVQKLGSNEFVEREQAWETLVKMGPGIRPDLEACLTLTTDLETQLRLKTLLKKLPAVKNENERVAFDQFVGKGNYWGYLLNPTISVMANGKEVKLNRSTIRKISVRGLGATAGFADTPAMVGFRRISEKEFPPGCLQEPFETDVRGQRLSSASNLEREFVRRGFLLTTNIKGDHVGIRTVIVSSKSRSNSIGLTRGPAIGEFSVRFVQPNFAHVPAGVSHFGCWAGSVVPNGATFTAIDTNGQIVGKLVTQGTDSEFLGFSSTIPIQEVRITTNPKFDTDVVLDDLIFKPVPVPQASRPGQFAVRLESGDIIYGKEIKLTETELHLTKLTSGLPDMQFPLTKVTRVNYPQQANVQPGLPAGVYAQLDDGSIIFGQEPEDKYQQPKFTRFPELTKSPDRVTAMWRSEYPRLPKPLTDDNPAAWDPEEQQWKPITFSRLLEELVMWKTTDGSFEASGYAKLPPIRMKSSPKIKPGLWHIRTTTHEDLVLSADQAPIGSLTEPLQVNWHGRNLTIPVADLVTIYRE